MSCDACLVCEVKNNSRLSYIKKWCYPRTIWQHVKVCIDRVFNRICSVGSREGNRVCAWCEKSLCKALRGVGSRTENWLKIIEACLIRQVCIENSGFAFHLCMILHSFSSRESIESLLFILTVGTYLCSRESICTYLFSSVQNLLTTCLGYALLFICQQVVSKDHVKNCFPPKSSGCINS